MSAEPSPTDALVGRILAERYQILHRLGEGAMGVVYKARHVKVGRLFAVKVLHPRALEDSKVVTRFEREAELAGRLRHPNVIGVVDVGEVEGTRYMVMDFVEGPDLARLLDEAPMPPERITRLVRQMLEGLHHAHEAGLIHRDFKPENVIVERDSHGGELPRIVDFGIALLREGTGGGSGDGQGRLTTNGLVLGTPHYMAPEQAVADPIDHRIDLFALGIVIYEMLSGRLPFDGSGAEVARANLLIDPPPINKRVPHLEVDPLLEAFARKLMHKKRDARPATARAARELLDLIDRDRRAAAIALGVPVARSGRQPADTEPVDAGATMPDATTRMKPTPRGSEPALPSPPGDAPRPPPSAPPPPTGMGVPAWMAPAAEMSPPAGAIGVAVAYPGEAAPPPAFGPPGSFAPPGPPRGPPVGYPGAPYPPPNAYAPHAPPHRHRDTGLRTPLGWQTASHPARRRRSWLLGGAVLITAVIVTAAAITWSADRDAAPPGDAVATVGPVTAPSSERSPAAVPAPPAAAAAPSVSPPPSETAAAAPPAPSAPSPARPPDETATASPATSAASPSPARPPVASAAASPRTPGATPSSAPPPVETSPATRAHSPSDTRRPAPPSRVQSKPAAPRPEAASPAAPQRAADDAPPRAPDPAPEVRRAAEPPRVDHSVDHPVDRPAEPPPAEHAAAPPAGLTASALGVLFDQVKHEIEAVPADRQKELLDQLAMIGVTRAMIGSQFQRDEAAAKLARLRVRVRERMAR